MIRSRLVLVTLLALSSGLVGDRPASATAADQLRESVVVTGTGEVFGEPDMITANFAVETVASTVGEALTRAGTAATRMRDTLVRAGLTGADLRTSHAGISSRTGDDGAITGYAVSQGLTATIRKLPRAGALISDAIAAGGDAARLNGVSFGIQDTTALLAEARRKAFADARGKAELYAREARRPLGRVLTLSETAPGYSASGERDSMAAADVAVPIEPGRQRLAATVTVEWALRPAQADSAAS
jgi:uncharacterized protein YggE